MDVSASNKRRSRILGALTPLYIQSARPVSSQLIKKEYSLSISTATIRSIMAELEEAGYIAQTHTSSGRVPTDRGYRFYIDSLMKEKGLSFE
ncbi:MAG: hypothetical protein KAU12_01880, partial [Candidatus Omnitrophica bacterium]|nr:hypothetical protein [Candidatus Omnitrophota bacterium]